MCLACAWSLANHGLSLRSRRHVNWHSLFLGVWEESYGRFQKILASSRHTEPHHPHPHHPLLPPRPTPFPPNFAFSLYMHRHGPAFRPFCILCSLALHCLHWIASLCIKSLHCPQLLSSAVTERCVCCLHRRFPWGDVACVEYDMLSFSPCPRCHLSVHENSTLGLLSDKSRIAVAVSVFPETCFLIAANKNSVCFSLAGKLVWRCWCSLWLCCCCCCCCLSVQFAVWRD